MKKFFLAAVLLIAGTFALMHNRKTQNERA